MLEQLNQLKTLEEKNAWIASLTLTEKDQLLTEIAAQKQKSLQTKPNNQ